MVKLRCKLVILGDSTVGKTSIVRQFTERSFPQPYIMTTGVNFQIKVVRVPMEEFITDEERVQWQGGHNTLERSSIGIMSFGDSMTSAPILRDDHDTNGNDDKNNKSKTNPELLKHEVELFIYDIGTSPIYEKDIPQYLSNVTAFILVYDVTNLDSFRNLAKYFEMVKQEKVVSNERSSSLYKIGSDETVSSSQWESPIGVLLANKIDSSDTAKVNLNQGQIFARRNNLEFFQCSAMQNESVETPFHFIADRMYRMYKRKLERINAMTAIL